jgi:diguanylate cyclase
MAASLGNDPDLQMSTTTQQPHEIAREALRRLAGQRMPPTPDNYRALYHEIAGTQDTEPFPEKGWKTVLGGLPRETPQQLRVVRELETAGQQRDWSAVRSSLTGLIRGEEVKKNDWGKLFGEVLGQIGRRHAGITAAKKREALDTVLGGSGADPDLLYDRLSGLVRGWDQAQVLPDAAGMTDTQTLRAALARPADTGAAAATTASPEGIARADLAASLIERLAPALAGEDSDLGREAQAIARALRSDAGTDALGRFDALAARCESLAHDQSEIRQGLQHLLQIVVANVGDLVADDSWLQGQVQALSELLGAEIDVRRLDDAQRRLKDVIIKQGALRKGLSEAQERLKTMLARFVDHLAGMTTSTRDYHDKIESAADRISQARDIEELSDVIEEVLRETRSIQGSAARSHDDLRSMQTRVGEAEQEIARLRSELEQTSKMVRHDPLTGSYNRKGLEEVYAKEIARSRRRKQTLSIALLDLDHFKRLNDTYGHQAGDLALVHLARTVQSALRPNDTVARYGGEEFVVLLPDTGVADAAIAMARVQRELTRQIFMHDNERILITFSAGVTQVADGDAMAQAIERADRAMYEAKRSGRNRVVEG